MVKFEYPSKSILLLILIVAVVAALFYKNVQDFKKDHQAALDIIKRLEVSGDDIVEVSKEFLIENQDGILMVKTPEKKKENMTFFHPANTKDWPYYHYTYPYQYLEGGAWPPNMYSKMYHWQPGYDTAGWSYWMRPGIYYSRWPRNRWVRNNSSYYFINNGPDRSKDYLS